MADLVMDEAAVLARVVVGFGPGVVADDEPVDPIAVLRAAGGDPDDPWAWWQSGGWVVLGVGVTDGVARFAPEDLVAIASRVPGVVPRYQDALGRGRQFMAFSDLRVLCVPVRAETDEAVRANAVRRLAGWRRAHPTSGLIALSPGCGLGPWRGGGLDAGCFVACSA